MVLLRMFLIQHQHRYLLKCLHLKSGLKLKYHRSMGRPAPVIAIPITEMCQAATVTRESKKWTWLR